MSANHDGSPVPLRRRLGWFVTLWLAGVAVVVVVAYAIRWLMP